MQNANRFIRQHLLSLNECRIPVKPFRIKLDQNENPFDLPEALKQEVWLKLQQSWARYPEDMPAAALEKIAGYSHVPPDYILLGNGISGLLTTILTATQDPGATALIPKHTFRLYHHVCRTLGLRIIETESRSDFAPDVSEIIQACSQQRPDVLLLAAPNNPVGRNLTRSELQLILDSHAGLVILDEAYWEFAGSNYLELLSRYDNIILLRTLSKALHLASARLGYAIARPELIRELRKLRLPYETNLFSLVSAEVVLSHPDWLQETIDAVIHERQRVYYELVMFPHVKPYPTQTNFIFLQTSANVGQVTAFLSRYGILVSNLSEDYQIPNGLRVTVGQREENDVFLDALFASAEGVS